MSKRTLTLVALLATVLGLPSLAAAEQPATSPASRPATLPAASPADPAPAATPAPASATAPTAPAPAAPRPAPNAPTNRTHSAFDRLGARVARVAFYENRRWGTVIKPIVRLAGGINHQLRTNDGQAGTSQQYEDRLTTVSILQFGLAGQLFKNLTFYSEFEKNLGAYGTSVWNGTAALQARANYLQYRFHGASIAAGIIVDPASVDFLSAHVLDVLGRDASVATVPFHGGLNMSQGVRLSYSIWDRLDLGLTFTASNPLATSLSFGFGGKVASIGNIYFLPTKTISLGDPGSNAQLMTLSPGFVLRLPTPLVDLELRGVVQLYFVNIDANSDSDAKLTGQNYKGSIRLSLLDGMIQPFFNGNYRRNEMLIQIEPIDISSRSDDPFVGWTVGLGADFNVWKKNGLGFYYGRVDQEPGVTASKTFHYLNIGATFWLMDDLLAVGARYAKQITQTDGETDDGVVDYDSYFATLRLVLN